MVLPEGTREEEHNRPRKVIAVGAGMVLLLAILALGLVTAPDESTAQRSTTTTTDDESLHEPTTTTYIDIETFSVSDIATDDHLSWREAPPVGSGWPIELLEHGGQIYLFTSQPVGSLRDPYGGLQVWTSSNGIQWNRSGDLAGSEYSVTHVDSIGDGLIALGFHTGDGSPHLWTSSDGVEWSGSALPGVNLEPESPNITRLTDSAPVGDQLIITGTTHVDSRREIIEHLPDEIADIARRYGMGLSGGPDGRVLEIHGPLGIIGYSATLDELGIDEETANRYFHGPSTEQSFVWTSHDGSEWTTAELGDVFVEHLWSTADGELIASGWDNSGPSIWTSADGESWESEDVYQTRVADQWSGSLIGIRGDRELVRSVDGQEWQPIWTETPLPASISWNLGPVDAGPGGIAVIASAWTQPSNERSTSATTSVDGYRLTLDQLAGKLTVQDGSSGRVVAIPIWSNQASDTITVDFENEVIRIVDPEDGDEMVAVDFAVLNELEIASFGGRAFAERALLLGDENGNWKILDLSAEIGDREWVAMMRVIGNRLILATYTDDAWLTGDGPTISVRVATLR